LIYRVRLYLVFILFIISLIVILLRDTVHARFIHQLNCMIACIPLLFLHFSTVYTTRIHSLGALQHCSTWISLEFLWNSTYTGTWLPGLATYLSYGFMEISLITYHRIW